MQYIQIDRAFKTILALQKGVTANELADILEFKMNTRGGEHEDRRHLRSSAMHYIDSASLYMPVVEAGKRRNPGCYNGPGATVYKILDGKELR